MYNFDKLIESGANIKLEVSPCDLKEFGIEIAQKTIEKLSNTDVKKDQKNYLNVKDVCKLFDISRVTLWQWDKKGITKPIHIGNLKRYSSSDIEAMGMQHKLNHEIS